MTSAASLDAAQSLAADAQMTAERSEAKYLVPAKRGQTLMAQLAARLSAHRYQGEGANRLPGARHFITTVYYDTPSRALLRAAEAQPQQNVKVRVRQYYDFHPGLAEVATAQQQLVRYQPSCFIELKRRQGERSSKLRSQLPLGAVRAVLAGDSGSEACVDGELLRALSSLRAELAEPLSPSCVAHYQRLPFQDVAGSLRITIDHNLAFFEPAPDLFERSGPLRPATMGTCRARETRVLVEVKSRAEEPGWLRAALDQAGAERVPYSKFVEAGRAVQA